MSFREFACLVFMSLFVNMTQVSHMLYNMHNILLIPPLIIHIDFGMRAASVEYNWTIQREVHAVRE